MIIENVLSARAICASCAGTLPGNRHACWWTRLPITATRTGPHQGMKSYLQNVCYTHMLHRVNGRNKKRITKILYIEGRAHAHLPSRNQQRRWFLQQSLMAGSSWGSILNPGHPYTRRTRIHNHQGLLPGRPGGCS